MRRASGLLASVLLVPAVNGSPSIAAGGPDPVHFGCALKRVDPANPGTSANPRTLQAAYLFKGSIVGALSPFTREAALAAGNYSIDDPTNLMQGRVTSAGNTEKGYVFTAGSKVFTLYRQPGTVWRAILNGSDVETRPFDYFYIGRCKLFATRAEWQAFEKLDDRPTL